MNSEEDEAKTNLDATLDGGKEKVEGEDGVSNNAEKGEGIIESNQHVIQEGVDEGGVVQENMKDPHDGETDA